MPSANILEAKKVVVAGLIEELKDAKTIVLVDYRGINVEDDTAFRAAMRKAGVTYKVVKNTLVKLAMKEIGVDGLDSFLEGPTAIAFSTTDVVAPAKVVNEFAKKVEALEIKSGVMEGKVVSLAEIKAIAELPSKEVLLASLAGVLNQNIAAFARAIDAIVQKQGAAVEVAAEAPAEEAAE